MKKSEAVRVLAELRARFPKTPDFDESHAAAYCTELIDLEYEPALQVVSILARTTDWFPSIAQFWSAYSDLVTDFPDADELWTQVLRWANETGFGRQRTNEVPPTVRVAVEFLGGFSELGKSENLAVERAHLLKAYPAMRARSQQTVARRLLGSGSKGLLSGGKEEG